LLFNGVDQVRGLEVDLDNLDPELAVVKCRVLLFPKQDERIRRVVENV
jgi:hypothetical protein